MMMMTLCEVLLRYVHVRVVVEIDVDIASPAPQHVVQVVSRQNSCCRRCLSNTHTHTLTTT